MKLNLSQKLFTQKDGKRFVYADEIRESVKKLKEEIKSFNTGMNGHYATKGELLSYILKQIEEIFGKELSE